MKNARDVRACECILHVAVRTYERSPPHTDSDTDNRHTYSTQFRCTAMKIFQEKPHHQQLGLDKFRTVRANAMEL